MSNTTSNVLTLGLVTPSRAYASMKILSPVGGNNGDTDYLTASPDYEGQLGVAWYSGGVSGAYLYFAGTSSEWKHGWSFPAGVFFLGSQTGWQNTTDAQYIRAHVNGCALGYTNTGDSGIVIYNWSLSSGNSGASIILAVMGNVDAGGGMPAVIDSVGLSLTHTPANRASFLIPGNSMIPFNTNNTHNKGFYICTPGGGTGGPMGSDSGNFSYFVADGVNHLMRVPKWVAGVYQPSDAGWLDSFSVNPVTGHIEIGQSTGTIANGGHVNIAAEASAGIISIYGRLNFNNQGNGECIRVTANSQYSIGIFGSEFCLIWRGIGIQFQNAGEGLHFKEGSNAIMGTLTLNGATEVTVNTTKVTATSRIFLAIQSPAGTVSGVAYVSSRVAGTSFGVKGIALDTSIVAWMIVEPTP